MTWTNSLGKTITVGVVQLAQSSVTEQGDSIMRAGVASGSYLTAVSLPLEKIDLLGGSKEERAFTDVLAATAIQTVANRFILNPCSSIVADAMMALSVQVVGVYAYDVLNQGSRMRDASVRRAVMQ